MNDYICSYVVYGTLPDEPLTRALDAILQGGWTVDTHRDGDFEYMAGDELRMAETTDQALSDVDTCGEAAVAVERGELRIWLEKDSDRLPTIESWHLYVWSDRYDYEHERAKRTREEVRENLRQYVDLVQLVVEATDPSYGFGKFGYLVAPEAVPTVDDLLDSRAREAFWLNVFDEQGVERLGRERVLDAPAWDVRELETGHAMVIVSDHPFEPAEEWADAEAEVAEHLDLEYETMHR